MLVRSITRRTTLLPILSLSTLLSFAVGCSDDEGPDDRGMPTADAGVPDSGDETTDAGETMPDAGDEMPDAGEPMPDAGEEPDSGMPTMCGNPALTPPASGTCSYTIGTSSVGPTATLIRGDIITPSGILENGHLLVGAEGRITCAACDCSSAPGFEGAAVMECAEGLVSPALINMHDHITFTETPPTPQPEGERYDHRHDWRRGLDGATRIPSVGNDTGNEGVWWGEIRNLMAGATAINGSGGALGLLRNLDRNGAQQEGLNQAGIFYSTFPLDDSTPRKLTDGCGYEGFDDPMGGRFENAIAYAPHIAEGIETAARNEFLCQSSDANGGVDVITGKTAVVHAIALNADDWKVMADSGASLVWSPRSNIALYGITADVVLAQQSGVNITLGTDWTQSGSMNMLRELHCADEYNQRNLSNYFTDRELFEMVTQNAALSFESLGRLGVLAPGREADVTIFRKAGRDGYRPVLDAEPEDVVLVLRSGLVMYGDADLVGALPESNGCEALDVCGTTKSACVERETGRTISQLQTTIENAAEHDLYELFFCDEPPMEPTCVPFRSGEFMGVGSDTDTDGDGITDDLDNCPGTFNPIRPMDEGVQSDVDDDMIGDACDVCPVNADTVVCEVPDPKDGDMDGVSAAIDNCPAIPNADQADMDDDGIGDLCDQCPEQPNPGGQPCTVTIYDIKQGNASGRIQVADVLVSVVAGNGFFLQVDPNHSDWTGPEYSGVFVFNGSGPKPTVGDRITLQGDVGDFFGQTQLSGPTWEVLESDLETALPTQVSPIEVSTGTRAAALEGTLVEVRSVMVTEQNPSAGPGDSNPTDAFVLDTVLEVHDYLHREVPLPEVNSVIPYVIGLLRFANQRYKLEPRDAFDVGIQPEVVAIEPNPVYVPVGVPGVPVGGLSVFINRPSLDPFVVSLSTDDSAVVVPADVTIMPGDTSAPIPVDAMTIATTTVTLSATAGTVTATAGVITYDDISPRFVTSLSITPEVLPTNGNAEVVATLNLPGQTTGTPMMVDIDPPDLVTITGTTTFDPGVFEARFTIESGLTQGMGDLTVWVGTSSLTASFEVLSSVIRNPTDPGDLIITEIHRNPSGSGEQVREWFEIHNPTTDTLVLSGLTITDNSATHVLVAPGVTLLPGGYGVIAFSSDMAQNGGVTVLGDYMASNITLANTDDILRIGFGGTEIDVVDWDGAWPRPNGISICLRFPYPADNNDISAWNLSVGQYGTTTDQGSPNQASDATNCP